MKRESEKRKVIKKESYQKEAMRLAGPKGFEPPAYGLRVHRSA
jgi:hypothetical protein